MNDNHIDQLKQSYLHTSVADELVYSEWSALSGQLGKQQLSYHSLVMRGIATFSLLLFLTGGFMTVSQAALPGDRLYSVKALTDTTVAKVTGRYDILVVKRANDIIEVAKQSPDHLDQALNEYKKAVAQAQSENKTPQQKQEFKKTLDEQTDKFKDEEKQNATAAEKLQEVILHTQEVKKEVKGASSEKKIERKNTDDENSHIHSEQASNKQNEVVFVTISVVNTTQQKQEGKKTPDDHSHKSEDKKEPNTTVSVKLAKNTAQTENAKSVQSIGQSPFVKTSFAKVQDKQGKQDKPIEKASVVKVQDKPFVNTQGKQGKQSKPDSSSKSQDKKEVKKAPVALAKAQEVTHVKKVKSTQTTQAKPFDKTSFDKAQDKQGKPFDKTPFAKAQDKQGKPFVNTQGKQASLGQPQEKKEEKKETLVAVTISTHTEEVKKEEKRDSTEKHEEKHSKDDTEEKKKNQKNKNN